MLLRNIFLVLFVAIVPLLVWIKNCNTTFQFLINIGSGLLLLKLNQTVH